MTRFSETEKWRDPWFRSLKPPQKLLFLFIVDNCNNAGFWEEDKDYACYATGMNEDQYEGAIKGLLRGLIGASGWFWVKNFLKHQKNDNLNPDNRAHAQIIKLLKEQVDRFSEVPCFSPFLAPYKGLLSPSCIGKVKVMDGEVQERKPRERANRGTREEFEAYAVERKCPASDGSGTFDHFESNGWMLGKNPVKDWKAAFRTRQLNGWLPSQQNGNGRHSKQQASDQPKPTYV